MPGTITGANVSLHALCKRLVARGLDPRVLCASDAAQAATNAHTLPPDPNYPVERRADPVVALQETIEALKPQAIVVRAPEPAERVVRLDIGRRLHIYFESAFFRRSLPSPRDAPNLCYGANSPFLARMGEAYLGAPVAMVPPVIEPADYRCEPSGDGILFVNPVAVKGVHIAAAIAERLPHRRFLFVRSWPDHPRYPHHGIRLTNIEWVQSRQDMRPLFARTRLLLMPSVWEESSGRVLGEAQISGIPAVASDRGGLRESVGPGGVVLPLDATVERWCATIEAVFEDQAHFAALARGARQHAARPDYLPDQTVARFLAYIAS